MDLFYVIFIALSLSADCFAVALSGSIAMRTPSYLQMFRTSFSFGFFQFMMPILGWLAGRSIVEVISAYDHWAGFALLTIVASRMIWESFHAKDSHDKDTDITKGGTLLLLSLATSIDALAVGLSLAFIDIDIKMASVVIGIVAFGVTIAGFSIGKKAGSFFGNRAKLVGGLILIGIGLRLLLTHIL